MLGLSLIRCKHYCYECRFSTKKLVKQIYQNIKGVTGNYLQVVGMLDIGLDINNVKFKHRVHVIKDLHHSFILDLDFLTANHAYIDTNH